LRIAFVNPPETEVLPPYQKSEAIWTYQVAERLAVDSEVLVYSSRSAGKQASREIGGVQYKFISLSFDRMLSKLLRRSRVLLGPKKYLYSSALSYLGFAMQVGHDIKKNRCDIIHIHTYTQFLPIIRMFNQRAKIVLHMHYRNLSLLDRRMMENRLRSADLILGCSDYLTGDTRSSFPAYGRRCRTIVNGVDVERFRPEPEKMAREGGPRILFVGRISPEKGIHILLDAFKNVLDEYPGAELEVIGPKMSAPLDFIVDPSDDPEISDLSLFYEGESRLTYFQHLDEMVSSSGIRDRVHFPGHLPQLDLVDHYRNADILVNPSLTEAFGMSLIEAMACGTPTIATRTGGMVEIVDEGRTGLLVERGNARSLASAIIMLLSNQGLRKEMGKAGRLRAVELFSWERVVRRLRGLYQETN
jgi:glycosyltransferase involved in cell wall biosynthesis